MQSDFNFIESGVFNAVSFSLIQTTFSEEDKAV